MAQSSSATKIDFKKKISVAQVKKPVQVQAHVMRVITNQTGVIVETNDAFAASLGIPPLDLKGRNLLDTVLFKNFDDLVDDRALFNNISFGENMRLGNLRAGSHTLLIGKNHEPYVFHFDWIKNSDGQRYLVASSAENDDIRLDNVQVPAVTNAVVEVEKKQSKTKISKTLENNPVSQSLNPSDIQIFSKVNKDVMCVMQSDGTIIRGNNILNEIIAGEKLGNFIDYVVADDRAAVRQYIQSFQKHDTEEGVENSVSAFEARMLSRDSKTMWMQWTIHRQKDELYCLGHDVTTEKLNEISLKRREQELSEAQALASMGHWRWKVGAAEIDWSDEIYKIFGVERGEFIPTLDNTNNLLHKRDLGHMMQAFQRAIIEQNDYDIDFRVVRNDGSLRYIRCEGRCELDDDGDVVALYGVMQDITEQTEYQMQLQQAKDSAEQAYASKSRFLANMSHELRTPLNAIIGFSDMINRQMLGAVGNGKYLEYAGSIKDSGEHLLSLITDILDMSKIEAGKYELDLEDVQLGEVVHTAVRMIGARAQEGGIAITNNVDNFRPVIVADRRAVMQILLNVLSNAVKFTPTQGSIKINIDEFDNHVSIKVTDSGIGIPANKLSAVLKPFEQVSTALTRNHEGSGLGLAITKELAELHGGMLSLESSEGNGTTVAIRLPKNAREKQKRV